jgi:hypothetical protein
MRGIDHGRSYCIWSSMVEKAALSLSAFLTSSAVTYGYSPYSKKLGKWCSRTNFTNESGFSFHHADIAAALQLGRRQSATLFELRAASDDFELRGKVAGGALVDVVSRFSADGAFPELAPAEALLR